MTEPDLERLIADWYRPDLPAGEESRLPASADCPTLMRLWQHHVEALPLGEYEDHVEHCDRCRRLGEIIEREQVVVAADRRRRIYSVTFPK